MHYQFLVNIEKDGAGRWLGFSGYQQSHALQLAYAGAVDAHNDQHACNLLFEQFNIGHPADYRGRSMSVGDVVLLDYSRAYAVKGIGWDRIAITTQIQAAANPNGVPDEAEAVCTCGGGPDGYHHWNCAVIREKEDKHSATDPGSIHDQRFGSDADNGVDW